MIPFTLEQNKYLTQNIQGFYHTIFGGVDLPNNPNFLYKLKNDQHHNWTDFRIQEAQEQFRRILNIDLPAILRQINKNPLTVCVVPRSKADNTYRVNQLLFKSTIQSVVDTLTQAGFNDGANYITRHTNTKTTHLRNPVEGFNNEGPMPYVGITNATCYISDEVIGKDILLIDDIYTKTVNIDEDAIQSLISKGAKSVAFYAIGNTISRQ